MGRIKRGLDYFPMSTSFMHDRMVRRIMRREGDSAFATLVETLSYIYAGKGYYISVGDEFYEELVDSLYSTELDDVKRIISLSVEYGLFDAGLFRQYNILTSADIQRQYLFITKRRSSALIEPDYCLLESEEITSYRSSQSGKSSTDDSLDSECAEALNGDADHKTACTVTSSSDSVTMEDEIATSGTQNKRKQTMYGGNLRGFPTRDSITRRYSPFHCFRPVFSVRGSRRGSKRCPAGRGRTAFWWRNSMTTGTRSTRR